MTTFSKMEAMCPLKKLNNWNKHVKIAWGNRKRNATYKPYQTPLEQQTQEIVSCIPPLQDYHVERHFWYQIDGVVNDEL